MVLMGKNQVKVGGEQNLLFGESLFFRNNYDTNHGNNNRFGSKSKLAWFMGGPKSGFLPKFAIFGQKSNFLAVFLLLSRHLRVKISLDDGIDELLIFKFKFVCHMIKYLEISSNFCKNGLGPE